MFAKIYAQVGHPLSKLFIHDPEEHKRAALNMVRLCQDFAPTGPDGKFYLPKRKKGNAISEFDGPWLVGGAIEPFMTEGESMFGILKRELGLDIDLNRLTYITDKRYWLNGKAMGGYAQDAYSFIYSLPLSWSEIASVKLDPKEYEGTGLSPYGCREISQIKDQDVRQIITDIWEHPTVAYLRQQALAA